MSTGDFRLQRSVLRAILKDRPSVRDGMAMVLQRVIDAPYGKAWRPCLEIDWSTTELAWVKWLDHLLKVHPPKAATEVLWFEVPSDLNPALTSVSGYPKLASKDDNWGMEDGRDWPTEGGAVTHPDGLLELPQLDEAWKRAGWWDDDGDENEVGGLLPGVYATAFGLTALLVLNGLPRTTVLSKLTYPRGIAVLAGWAEGGEEPIGQLDCDGWKPIRRVKPPAGATAAELDPESLSFNLEKYLRAGGNLEVRGKPHGETLLMRHRYHGPAVVKRLLAAGADARAVTRDGAGVLHWYGAAEIESLKALTAAGADPMLLRKNGWTVLDTIVHDGRCTREHLEFYWELGVRLGKAAWTDSTPLHTVAASNVTDKSDPAEYRKMFQFWMERGIRLDDRDKSGMTPLWAALFEHMKEGDAAWGETATGRRYRMINDYHHDSVAIVLLELGADPNDVYVGPKTRYIPAGATPLMLQRYDDDKLVSALLKAGADPNATCAAGKTPLDYAQAVVDNKRHADQIRAVKIVTILKQAMKRTVNVSNPLKSDSVKSRTPK